MSDNICVDCGSDMSIKVIKQGNQWRRRIARYECECGFQTSAEANIEFLRRTDQEYINKWDKKYEEEG